MMGYIYLAAALFAGIAKGYCGKTVSRDMKGFNDCTFINLMRMLFCAAVGLALALVRTGTGVFELTAASVGIYILAAVSMSMFCVCWMYAYRTEAYMFLSVFTMLSTIVTCLLDGIIYHTPVRLNQWIGMAVLVCAVFIMSIYNKGITGKLTPKGTAILILGASGSSLADFSQKIYVREIGKSAEVFNFYMYFFGFVLLLAVYIMCIANKSTRETTPILYDKKHIGVYFLMAFFLYINSVTKTMAAGFLTSAQIYPVLQGANLILSAVMSHILFKEKINLKGIAGIVTAFAGLMIMNLL